MRDCILCGKPTTGSVGAAGLQWPMICQPCKDKEDQALAARINVQATALKALLLEGVTNASRRPS